MNLSNSLRGKKRPSLIVSLLDFFKQLKRHKVGICGFLLLLFYFILGIIGPYIAPHAPFEMRLAEAYAVPDWFVIFPQYRDYPPNIVHRVSTSMWELVEKSNELTLKIDKSAISVIYMKASETNGKKSLFFSYSFEYPYRPPKTFYLTLKFKATKVNLPSSYARINIYLVNTEGKRFLLLSKRVVGNESKWVTPLDVDSRDITLKLRLGVDPFADLAPLILNSKGTYKILLELEVFDRDVNTNGVFNITLGELLFRIPGMRYGLLGTDNNGSDLFSQLLYGARVSMIVGLLASSISVFLGLVIGVIAGYEGGFVDQFLLFITDTLYFMPILPLLIALSVFYGKNIYLQILLIASLSWMAFARTVRSYTLSLRESLFVEAVRAIGASDIYIIIKHIIPQLIPLIYVQLALSVPGAVLLEASLSFLGLGDPRVPSWGRMLYSAELAGAFPRLIWWWILPPGLMLTFFALSFILFGYALDEIFNPRLRVRR